MTLGLERRVRVSLLTFTLVTREACHSILPIGVGVGVAFGVRVGVRRRVEGKEKKISRHGGHWASQPPRLPLDLGSGLEWGWSWG